MLPGENEEFLLGRQEVINKLQWFGSTLKAVLLLKEFVLFTLLETPKNIFQSSAQYF